MQQDYLELEEVEAYSKLQGPDFKKFIVKEEVFLGREADEIIQDKEQIVNLGSSQKVSRKHARIFFDRLNGNWYFQNLSKNKTYVNNNVILKESAPLKLNPLDAIRINDYKFYYFPSIPSEEAYN